MTKRWSSTRSALTKTKRQASKKARREAKEMAAIAEEFGLDPLADFSRALLARSLRRRL